MRCGCPTARLGGAACVQGPESLTGFARRPPQRAVQGLVEEGSQPQRPLRCCTCMGRGLWGGTRGLVGMCVFMCVLVACSTCTRRDRCGGHGTSTQCRQRDQSLPLLTETCGRLAVCTVAALGAASYPPLYGLCTHLAAALRTPPCPCVACVCTRPLPCAHPPAPVWPVHVYAQGSATQGPPALECFAWVVVESLQGGASSCASSASFMLPPAIARLVLEEGMELGAADDLVGGHGGQVGAWS